ncbi:MAG: hypothetical protein AAF989_08770 [Planctomycetota bacterium]
MIHSNADPLDDLETAVVAFKNQTTSSEPPQELTLATIEALRKESANAPPIPTVLQPRNRREMMIRIAKYGTVGTAATILIAFGATLMLPGFASRSAFAQVIENVRSVKSAKYRLVQQAGNQPAVTLKSAFHDGVIRTEAPGKFVFLADTKTGQTMQLLLGPKVAVPGRVDQDSTMPPVRIADVVGEITGDDAEHVDTVQVDGKTQEVFRVSKLPAFMGGGEIQDEEHFHVWVDSETRMPTKIDLRTKMKQSEILVGMVFDQFSWDPEIEPSDFELKPPVGFRRVDGPIGAITNPVEKNPTKTASP